MSTGDSRHVERCGEGNPVTVVACWVRRSKSVSQLVMVSDSRATGFGIWDWCPKVLPLPRPATLIALAGDLEVAYAIYGQAVNASGLLEGNVTGRVDIGNLAEQVRRMLLDSRSVYVDDEPTGADPLRAEFLLGGWSWRHLRFEAYCYFWDVNDELQMQDCFSAGHSVAGVHFLGSGTDRARQDLIDSLSRHGIDEPDCEPLDAILTVIRDPEVREVGGVPQVSVVNQHGEVETFLMPGPDGSLHVGGRALHDHQRADMRALRLGRDEDGRLTVQPYWPPGLSFMASSVLAEAGWSPDE